MKSKALEINLECYRVDVAIEDKYSILQEIMSKYYGVMDGLNTFLKELSHPYKNWEFIVREARNYSLNYFHLLKNHPKGPDAATLLVNIFNHAIISENNIKIKADAVDNLLLFLQKIIKDSGPDIKRFMPVIDSSFDSIRNYKKDGFFLFVKSFYQIKRLAKAILNHTHDLTNVDYRAINLVLLKYFKHTYSYWLSEEDPFDWFKNEAGDIDDKEPFDEIFKYISHKQINKWQSITGKIALQNGIDSKKILQNLLELPAYSQIVEIYKEIPQRLVEAGAKTGKGNLWKLIFLFHTMKTPGLSIIYEEALRDINRTLSQLIEHEKGGNIHKLIEKTFSILRGLADKFPATVLNCVLNMGKGVYKTDQIDLVNFFIDHLVAIGFQSPMIKGVGSDWQIQVNSSHMQNIRTWLELIELNPKWSTRLISHLTIHLSLCGVFIKDTDLFPRDITRFLNSDIRSVYNLAKQLARLFPVYFNDIGAEGMLRDISTQLDELTHQKDVLIHFLRKQSHVESSSRMIGFMEAVINFWQTKNREILKPFIPPGIFDQIHTRGPYIDGVHRVMLHLKAKKLYLPDDLIALNEKELQSHAADISKVSEKDIKRVKMTISFYKLLHQKYDLIFSLKSDSEIDHYLSRFKIDAFPDIDALKKALIEPDLKKKLCMLLDYLDLLKKIIISSKSYEIREDIYKKRHFAVDIPSIYGFYHERKFDALGLTFRIESIVNALFEEFIESIDLSIITRATFYQIYDRLLLFNRALQLNGISSIEMERQLDLLAHLLEVRGFTFTQYVDIFKGVTLAVKNIINDYFHNIHEQNLTVILAQTPIDRISEKYLPKEGVINSEEIAQRVSEIFFRDRLALSLGLQQLDLFLGRILNTLFHQSDKLPKDKLHQLLNYDPQRALSPFVPVNKKVFGLIYLGNKGFNIIKLINYGLPVPPGFIITTEVFRSREVIDNFPPAREYFKKQLYSQICDLEKVTEKKFGDPKNPLLISVRSGGAVSQPGMMYSFLNVGLNEEIAAGIAMQTNNSWFAWDNYRRFLQCYGMSYNLERNDFDAIINEFKQRLSIPYKRGFPGQEMRKVALAYKDMIRDAGINIIEDPFEQLYMAIKSVLGSWEESKAKAYRKIMGISDDWGTAVTVQKMVFGNLGRQSGSGVFFTHNPRWSGDILRLWGDFTLGNQGEDVVSGLVNTMPISINQQDIEMRQTDITLESHFPLIFKALKDWSSELVYKKGWSPQEIEFTFESPSIKDLYLLQARDMTMRERKKVLTFYPEKISEDKYLGHGIGVSGGAMSGRVVFSLDEIDKWRKLEPETSLILLRADTVPDDIQEIYASDGLLTARGGLTSHAAVVAHRLGKTCVVGCVDLICNEKKKNCLFNKISLTAGDYISIDGREGSVYHDLIDIKEG
ncbi:MAG TPA: PEP/pyruvate-binding domain-containing protein [Anaerolineae bacterium]|nr:PEP/pyruvate-binding domain-containing protein [Anaerolineae bacterium]